MRGRADIRKYPASCRAKEFEMANWSDPRTATAGYATGASARGAAYDAGLKSYMLSVYNYMASGVLLTGVVAMLFSWGGETSPAYTMIAQGGPIAWVVMLAPLAIVFGMSFGQNRMSTGTMQILYWAFAVLMGLSLSTIFLQYTGTSIAQAFFATAAGFAGLSLYGYTTKKDLSAFGTFLIMGLVGLIVASVINLFLQSNVMELVISIVGVLLFAGLTAYDTQKIKSMYAHVAGTDMMGKVVIMGALSLYLDFINMFLFILRLFGSSRD
jgi:FtsH-binding integral membrane protein